MTDMLDVVDPDAIQALDLPAPRPTPPPGLVLPVAAPREIAAAIRLYEQTKLAILDSSDWQTIGTKPDGTAIRFIKRSGWSKLALAMGASTTIVEGYPRVHRDEHGVAVWAECKVIARAPNGRECEGYGVCAMSESRFTQQENRDRRNARGDCTHDKTCPLHWAHAGDPVTSARGKLDHDLPATARTRARNIACSDLFGNGELSAEEIDPRDVLPWGASAQPEPPTPRLTDRHGPGATTTPPQNGTKSTPGAGASRTTAPADAPAPSRSFVGGASPHQIETIAKLSRLLGKDQPTDTTLTATEASDTITTLSAEYNAREKARKTKPAPPAPEPPPAAAPVAEADPDAANDRLGPGADAAEADPDAVREVALQVALTLDVAPDDLIRHAQEDLDLDGLPLDQLSFRECARLAQRILAMGDEEPEA